MLSIQTIPKFCCLEKSKPNEKNLDQLELITFADDKLNMNPNLNLFWEGKTWSLKVGIVWLIE